MAFPCNFCNPEAFHSFRCKRSGFWSQVSVLLVILLCIDNISLSSAVQQNVNLASSANADGFSKKSCEGLNKSLTQRSSALTSPAVRDVTARPISDISITHGSEEINLEICPSNEKWCAVLGKDEKLALEAIYALHHQLDDDKNGNIDPFESDEYLREELKYDKDYEKRQENFHKNNDHLVSVKELWQTWVRSEAHNWTADQTVEWFEKFVGLSEIYRVKFIELEINGTYLPRLAVNHNNFLSKDLGIKDVITRQKLNLKAQDVVLFGPPRENTNNTLDAILFTLLIVAITICYLVYRRYKLSLRDLRLMSKDMATMVKTEESLKDLQKELEQAKRDQEVLELEAASHHCSPDEEDEILKLRDEVLLLRNELQHAHVELQETCWLPPPALTHWLQKTYELEAKTHDRKRLAATKQLQQAKDACEKLRKKRSSVIGAFVATHANAIDAVDKAIMEARNVLTEVTQEFQERMKCWQQIEMLLKSPIVNTSGPSRSSSSHGISETRTNPMGSRDILDFDDDDGITINCGPPAYKPSPLPRCQSLQSMAHPNDQQEIRQRLQSNVERRQNINSDVNVKAGNETPKLMTTTERRLAFRTAVTESRIGPQFPYYGRLVSPMSHEASVFNFEANGYYPQRSPLSPGTMMIPKTRDDNTEFGKSFTFDEEVYLNNNRNQYPNDSHIQQVFHH